MASSSFFFITQQCGIHPFCVPHENPPDGLGVEIVHLFTFKENVMKGKHYDPTCNPQDLFLKSKIIFKSQFVILALRSQRQVKPRGLLLGKLQVNERPCLKKIRYKCRQFPNNDTQSCP